MALPYKAIGIVAALGLCLIAVSAGMTWSAYKWAISGTDRPRALAPTTNDKKLTAATLETKNRVLQEKILSFEPKGLNIVVDTAANRLFLRQGEKIIREAIVSCGSGAVLPNPKGKEWVFDTPHGEYKIESKKANPVWTKPDWAFVEEGREIPPRNSEDRIEPGVLGAYALGIGQGFFLHGTLYTRMLGRNVTHGCVRIGDEDLKALYTTVPVGTKVYLY